MPQSVSNVIVSYSQHRAPIGKLYRCDAHDHPEASSADPNDKPKLLAGMATGVGKCPKYGLSQVSKPSPRPSCFSLEHTPSAHLHVTLLGATRKCWCYPSVSADADNGRRPQIASAQFEITASLTDEAAQTTAGRNPGLPGTPNAPPHPPRRRLTTTRQKLRAT